MIKMNESGYNFKVEFIEFQITRGLLQTLPLSDKLCDFGMNISTDISKWYSQ